MSTQAIEDYLKTIYKLQNQKGTASTSSLAKRLGLSPASVTGMIKKLSRMKLVRYERYQGVTLTDAGKKIALEVIRHHRLVELYLSETLGVPWDKVHDEAEKWEHILSEELEVRIDKLLGYPTSDPHGSPIPTRHGIIPERNIIILSELKEGQSAIIAEVSDRNPDILRYLGERNLYPQTEIKVIVCEPFDGPITIAVHDTKCTLGQEVAKCIFVSDVKN